MKKPINLYALWPSVMVLAIGALYYVLCRAESISSFSWVKESGIAGLLPTKSLIQAQNIGFVPSMLFSFSLAYGLKKMNLSAVASGGVATGIVLLNEVLQLAGIMRGLADVWDFLAALAAAGLAVLLATQNAREQVGSRLDGQSHLTVKAAHAYWAIYSWVAGHALIVLAS